MNTTFQQICATSDEIRRDLDLWEEQLEAMSLKPSREYSEMKIEYCLLQLLLHRPSPTFMVPSRQMASYCSKAASMAIDHWSALLEGYGISAVCRCFRQLHDIILVGLAALYCDWQAMALPQSANGSQRAHRHLTDTATCLELIDQATDSQNLIYDDIMYSMGDGVEAYVNQVSEFLDGGGFNVDEALDAWYDALMGEIQSGGDSTMT
ncbi:hypothetical protein NW766_004420 [Fusarium irregulare]|uniref:Uncharacterized protein n=1 Tax=Fusarium irregulare TaxID=2494466 RepID=A0A9W8PS87_9HYPO|nr:hypothetical protein NW766_004420 [Fusarium irregulare]